MAHLSINKEAIFILMKNGTWLPIVGLLLCILTLSPAVFAATTEKPNISSFSPTSADRLSSFVMVIKGSGFSGAKEVVLTHKGCKAIIASQLTKTDNEILANFTIPNETGKKWSAEALESRKKNWCVIVPANNSYGMMCGFNIS
jgi:hypothetical protein